MKYLLIKDGAIRPEQGDLALEDMQRLVGGWVEHVTLQEKPDGSVISMYCNEEGKLKKLYPNFYLPLLQDVIAGNAIICGTDTEGNTSDLTDTDIASLHMQPGQDTLHFPLMLPALEVTG